MLIAHKIQLDPNKRQIAFFIKACGTARFCWNWGLTEWKREYEAGRKPSAWGLVKQFNVIQASQFPWVGEVNSHAKQQAFADLGRAFQNFFRRVKAAQDEKPGYPKYKIKDKAKYSFYMANIEFKIEGRNLKLPKKMGMVRMCEALRFEGKLMNARVSRTAGKWYASVQVEIEDPTPIHTDISGDPVGIHLGVRHMAVMSDGQVYDPPKPMNANLSKLQRAQKTLSRRQRGSNRYKKQRLLIQRLHKKIADIRANGQHQMTAKLTDAHPVLAVQAYDVKGMTKSGKGTVDKPGELVWLKRRFNRHNLDVGMAETRRQIEYKSRYKGAELTVIDVV